MSNDVLETQRQAAIRENLDALVAVSAENVAYTVGYEVPSQTLPIRKRQFFAVVTVDGRSAFLVVQVEHNEARNSSRIRDIRPYNEFAQEGVVVLADCLREFGLAGGRVGIELDALPARSFARLEKELPRATFVDAEKIFDHLRMIKTPEEIEKLRRCGQLVDQAHREVYATVHAGMTEMDVALGFMERLLKKGVDYLDKIVVGSGERSTFANCPPTQRVLRAGDVMRVDVFANIDGYMSDIARTSVVGHATDEQRTIWAKLVESENHLLELIRPGERTGAIWEKFLSHFRSLGLEPAINFLGHGIGLTLHEEPFISRYHDFVIEEGMVLAIEPVYFTGTMGFHLEDEIIVRSDHCEMISDGRGPLPEIAV
ncbi:MAG: Xaa-Pro peptidase family protein [Ardenticatenaceae bacterium]|nr:Xaa-Pro peptidase family protein [Ardenticatenaceae bacterium]HBY93065.1 hypothetical protein [Chloroflexota bacterium]